MTLKGISQNSDSITCIPNSQLKKAINLIEKGKVMEEEISLYKKNIDLLERQSTGKDKIIIEYAKKDSIAQDVISKYKKSIDLNTQTIANLELQNKIQKRSLFRQKLKKWGTLLLGFGAGFVIFN